jgi:hypothetical protein
MPRRRSWIRHARTLAICLLLGFVMTVAVAWGATLLWSDHLTSFVLNDDSWPPFLERESDIALELIEESGVAATGRTWFQSMDAGTPVLYVEQFDAGWPFRALEWRSVTRNGWETASMRVWIPGWLGRSRYFGCVEVQPAIISTSWIATPPSHHDGPPSLLTPRSTPP